MLPPSDKVIKALNIKDSMLSSANFLVGNILITYVILKSLISNLLQAIVAATNGIPNNKANMHK